MIWNKKEESIENEFFVSRKVDEIPPQEPLRMKSGMWAALENRLLGMQVGDQFQFDAPPAITDLSVRKKWAEKTIGKLRILRTGLYEKRGLQFNVHCRKGACYAVRLGGNRSETLSGKTNSFELSPPDRAKATIVKAALVDLSKQKTAPVSASKLIDVLSYDGLVESDVRRLVSFLRSTGFLTEKQGYLEVR